MMWSFFQSESNCGSSSSSADFHFELLRLRQNWRLKKVSNTILGDLSYRYTKPSICNLFSRTIKCWSRNYLNIGQVWYLNSPNVSHGLVLEWLSENRTKNFRFMVKNFPFLMFRPLENRTKKCPKRLMFGLQVFGIRLVNVCFFNQAKIWLR